MSSVSNSEQAAIRRVYDALSGILPGFSPTQQQRRMIGSGATAFASGRIAMIEAPTGVGKTVGYLVPGMTLAVLRDKRLVVATATAALQDQIALRDARLVAAAMTASGIEPPAWSVAKGRERYVCTLRLTQQTISPDLFARGQDLDTLGRMRASLESGSWNGERDAWPDAIDPALWKGVANTRHSCLGGRCSQASNCSYFAAADRAEAARVVIANHDLVLTSIARAEHSVFADFEKNLYVFDEAHHLADKAISAFASRASDGMDWAHDFPALLSRADAGQFRKAAKTDIAALTAILASLRVAFQQLAGDKGVYRFRFGEVPAQIRTSAVQAKAILNRLLDYLAAAEKATQSESVRLPLGITRGQIETAADGWDAFSSVDDDGGRPRARWVERDGERWAAVTSPFDSSLFLKRMLWDSCAGAVLTSATLAPLGSFDAARRALGLHEDDRVATERLDSPFDYSRARLRIPKMAHAPTDVAGHTAEVAARVRIVATGADGGVLVLFASAKQMRDVAGLLDDGLRNRILVQGDLPVSEILRRHRQTIESGGRSIIFGLASFAEGVDLPGKLCTRVVIAKIPFPAPDEPLIAAASEWVEKNGAQSFPVVMLPRGAMRFVQSVGRLMRSMTDWGEIIVLDRRLTEKSYGRKLRDAVPMRVVVA